MVSLKLYDRRPIERDWGRRQFVFFQHGESFWVKLQCSEIHGNSLSISHTFFPMVEKQNDGRFTSRRKLVVQNILVISMMTEDVRCERKLQDRSNLSNVNGCEGRNWFNCSCFDRFEIFVRVINSYYLGVFNNNIIMRGDYCA